MVRNTKFCSGPTVNVQDTIFHLFVKPPFQGCPGQGRGIFEGHLWWASLKGRSHTSVVRGLVFSFQFFHNSDEKWKWSNHSSWTLTSTMSSSSSSYPWLARRERAAWGPYFKAWGSLLVSGTVEEEEGWEEQVCHWGQIFENSAFNNVKSWF